MLMRRHVNRTEAVRPRADQLLEQGPLTEPAYAFDLKRCFGEEELAAMRELLLVEPERSDLVYWQRPKWLYADLLLPDMRTATPGRDHPFARATNERLQKFVSEEQEMRRHGGGHGGPLSIDLLMRVEEASLYDPTTLITDAKALLWQGAGFAHELRTYFQGTNASNSDIPLRYMLYKLLFPERQDQLVPPNEVIEKEREMFAASATRRRESRTDLLLNRILYFRMAAPQISLRDIFPEEFVEERLVPGARQEAMGIIHYARKTVLTLQDQQMAESSVANCLRSAAAIAMLEAPHISITPDHRIQFAPLHETEAVSPQLPARNAA